MGRMVPVTLPVNLHLIVYLTHIQHLLRFSEGGRANVGVGVSSRRATYLMVD